MGQGNFEFIRSEEPAWTGMLAVAKRYMLWAGAHEMGVLLLIGVAHAQKAVSVVLFRSIIPLVVPHVCVVDDHALSLADDEPAGELDILSGQTAPCTCRS